MIRLDIHDIARETATPSAQVRERLSTAQARTVLRGQGPIPCSSDTRTGLVWPINGKCERRIRRDGVGSESDHHAQSSGATHRARAILDTEFAVDIVEMPLERALRDEDRFGDLLVTQARFEALED